MSDVRARRSWLQRTFELQDPAHARLLPMEGLRGAAVILVFLQHYCVQSELIGLAPGVTAAFAAGLHLYGNFGVELFFVLSGYLIYGTLVRRRPAFLVFMWRRLVRLYPAFLVVFGLALVATVLFIPGRIPSGTGPAAWYLAANLFFVAGLVPMVRIVDVAWSLSYEMFFYLAGALLVLGLGVGRLPRPGRLAVLAALFVAYLAGCLTLDWMPLRMMPFFAGMALAEGLGDRVPGWAAWAPIAGALMLHWTNPFWGEAVQTASFFLLCAVCFRSAGTVSRIMVWTPLRWLGNMSYSYYLVHGFVVRAGMVALGHLLPGGMPVALFWLLLPAVFVATVGVSALLFVGVERPVSLR